MRPYSKGEQRVQIIKKTNAVTPVNVPEKYHPMGGSSDSSVSSGVFSMSDLGDIPAGYAKFVNILNEQAPESKANTIDPETETNRKCTCKPICCNLACCGYICLFILILIGIICLVIWSLIHHIHYPHFTAVYVELFSYNGFTEQLVPIIYVNGTGQLIAEIKNNMNMNGYIHDAEFEMLAVNIIGNKEQIGRVRCCGDPIKANITHPFDASMPYTFDKEIYIPSKKTANVTMMFSMPALSEEIWDLMITQQMTPENGYIVELMMRGYVNIKSKKWGLDMKVYTDCTVKANTSRFVVSGMNQVRLLKNVWPPRLYYYQIFPIHDANCTFSVSSIKYITQ